MILLWGLFEYWLVGGWDLLSWVSVLLLYCGWVFVVLLIGFAAVKAVCVVGL